MKRLALSVLVVLALAAPALAQIPGHVGDLSVYADDQGNNCNITDNGGNTLLTLFLVHKLRPADGDGSTGCRFKIDPPAGATWSYISFQTPFVIVGTADVDLSVGYGSCQTASAWIGSALYFSVVASPTCGYINLSPGLPGTVLATDCNFGEYPLPHGQAIANSDGSCNCNPATEPSTWGRVKSLYR